MIRTKLTTCIFLLFAFLAGISSAYENGKYEIPCEKHECGVDIGTDEARCSVHGDNQYIDYMGLWSSGTFKIPNGCKRSNIFNGDGYLVAYPSTGGLVLLRHPSSVDLQYLGLPHTKDTERSADEDDALATRMVRFGAQWWPNWDLYLRHAGKVNDGTFYDSHFPSDVHVAVPSTGGAWVANFTSDDARWKHKETREELSCESWLPFKPDSWRVKMRYALSMDDKAEMMKDMDATFYDTIDEVSSIAKTIDDAKSLFEPFKERLGKMEDHEYAWRFCRDFEPQGKDDINDKDTAKDKPRWGIWSLFNELR
ncbi:hypothetical protein QQS21_003566 [Conoideocrella luteorostrata]|uniref:Uncharacterized protein n=1 Tax=Conoideocrella luteorostrata TaxID=1105319 RepID=A0AAJ0FWA3_9HYPO|nr:hypothetical protein QQS21_003566 [Conoideocrella luteorostrata]